jgi:hypothetical protein
MLYFYFFLPPLSSTPSCVFFSPSSFLERIFSFMIERLGYWNFEIDTTVLGGRDCRCTGVLSVTTWGVMSYTHDAFES